MQLLAPEFDPDIDEDTQPTSTTTSQPQKPDNKITDANNPKTKNINKQTLQPDTDWPDAPIVQIPRVSLTVQEQPPEVCYIRKTPPTVINNQDIPEIEEDEPEDHTSYCHLITHHNTPQESERIRQEYSNQLQNIDNQQYYQKIDQDPQLTYYLPPAPYDQPQVGAT